MSYILDALKKAERERELGKIPSIDSTYPPLFTETNHYSRWLILLTVIGLIGFISVAFFWQPNKLSNDMTVLPTDNSNTIPATPIARPSVGTPSPLAHQAQVSRVSETVHDTAPPSMPAVSTPPTRPVSIPASPVVETAPVPSIAEVPQYLQQKLPELTINAHVYATEAKQRFVLINGRRYREGMSIQEGMTVEAIRPNDVVINYQQKRFRLSIR
ncbi:hypothetical protein BegalDRAFT_3541 [Beggiatoa alba B18LD]|uniref:Type II secretion system protein GspB C-terminal domain-containing protein n=1 Tax=Beggiatoa alba B18LD TaxID=395493 RepID=I3CL56_9GAMM|nr:general secretion pathway protein GspB [Beggiatoa alba]EIJ44349.1 hypothetical protein BegalDRAFT_3541 [Beggiatoa alba B18LD]